MNDREDPDTQGPDESGSGLDVDAEFAQIVAQWGPMPDADAVPPTDDAPEPDTSAHEPPYPGTPIGSKDSLRALFRPAWAEPTPPEPEDEDEHFVPPPPPPLPRPEPRRMLAWLGLFGAPVIGLVLLVSGVTLPRYVGVFLIAAFIAGFGYLVATMRPNPDGWDNGARL